MNEEGRADYSDESTACPEGATMNELALAYTGYGRLHRQQGNTAQAREYLTRALEIFEARLGTLGEPDRARQALTELSKG